MISAAQIKAARALLSMDQRELSNSAEVAISTVKRIELAEELTGSVRTLWKIQTALERAGVEFIPADEHKGPGVRLKEEKQKRPCKLAYTLAAGALARSGKSKLPEAAGGSSSHADDKKGSGPRRAWARDKPAELETIRGLVKLILL